MHRKTTSEKVEETGCYGYLKKNEKITNEIRIFNFGDKTTFLIIKQQKVATGYKTYLQLSGITIT